VPGTVGTGRGHGMSSGSKSAEARAQLPRETLEAVCRREPDALAVLFEHCFDDIYRLAYRLTGERTAAEDVSQEVFLKVHKAADQLDPSRDPGPWLAAITYNACREHWRSRGHRLFSRARSLNGEANHGRVLTNGRQDPEGATEAGEREELVTRALAKLPERMRAVVVLHDYQGMSHEEIARVTRTRHAAVRKSYSRALARLRDELKEVLG
jgi:RNA polymerase sigma factor (sigma-70 family)